MNSPRPLYLLALAVLLGAGCRATEAVAPGPAGDEIARLRPAEAFRALRDPSSVHSCPGVPVEPGEPWPSLYACGPRLTSLSVVARGGHLIVSGRVRHDQIGAGYQQPGGWAIFADGLWLDYDRSGYFYIAPGTLTVTGDSFRWTGELHGAADWRLFISKMGAVPSDEDFTMYSGTVMPVTRVALVPGYGKGGRALLAR